MTSLRIPRAALALALALAIFACCTLARAAQPTFRIDFILYRGCEDACRSFQSQLAKLGIKADIRLLDAEQNQEKLRRHIAAVQAARPDLVVTWGTSATLEAVGAFDAVDPARHITEVPVLFMVVSQPQAAKIVRTLAAPGRDVTGVGYLLPMETQLRAARAYLGFRRLGILYNPGEANSLIARDELAGLAGRFGFTLIERAIPRDEKGRPDPDSIGSLVGELAREGADLLYQPPDSFLHVHSDTLTAAALGKSIPVFAAAEAPVLKSQALFGVAIRYADIGRHTAYLAKKILAEGRKARELPVELPRQFSYLINMRVAAKLDLFPPLKLLDVAELTPAGSPGESEDPP